MTLIDAISKSKDEKVYRVDENLGRWEYDKRVPFIMSSHEGKEITQFVDEWADYNDWNYI